MKLYVYIVRGGIMRRWQMSLLVVGLPMLLVSLVVCGCKRTDEGAGPIYWDDYRDTSKAAAAVVKTPIKMGTGTIKGKVVWKGDKPDLGKLNSDMLASLGSIGTEVRVCLSPDCSKDEKDQQIYRFGPQDSVGNVVVYLAPPDKDTYFEITDKDLAALKLQDVTVGQPHCMFIPHVSQSFTHYVDPDNNRKLKATGQKVTVVNNSTTQHNTKWDDTGKRIRGDNKGLSPTGSLVIPMFPEAEPVKIMCSVHPWMYAYIWDFNHPYSDITKIYKLPDDDPNAGTYTYEIRNVPAGKLKIDAWHEDKERKIDGGGVIEMKEGETKTIDFEITKK
jgi:hypothetical protein